MVPIMLRNHDQTIIILLQQYPFLIITKWTNMVEIIREMGTIIESMPVIFPLNILSPPMDAMSGVKSSQTSEEIEPTACELRFTVVVKFIKTLRLRN